MKDNGVGDNLDVRLEKAKKELNDLKKELAKKKKQLEKAKEKIEIAQKKLDEFKKQSDMSLKKTKNNDKQKVISLKNINDKDNDKDNVKIDYTANPLDTNDIFGKIISEMKMEYSLGAGHSMYDLIIAFHGKDNHYNKEESMKLSKDLGVTDITKYSKHFSWFEYGKELRASGKEITKRIYVNMQPSKSHEFVRKFYESMRDDHPNLKYLGKFAQSNSRSDGIVIYTTDEYFNDVLGVVANVYENNKHLFDDNFDNCITTAKTGIPGVGVASEPVEDIISHNEKMAHVFDRSLTMGALKYVTENDEFASEYKEAVLDLYNYKFDVTDIDVLRKDFDEKFGSMKDFSFKLQKVLMSDENRPKLSEKELGSSYDNSLISFPVHIDSKQYNVELTEDKLFYVTHKTIKYFDDVERISELAEEHVRQHADFYNINRDNIAFRVGEDPKKILANQSKGIESDSMISDDLVKTKHVGR